MAAPPPAPTSATPTHEVASGASEPVVSSTSSDDTTNGRRVHVEVSAAGVTVDGGKVGSDQAALTAALLQAGGVVVEVHASSDAPAALILAALTVDAGPRVARRLLRWQDARVEVSEPHDDKPGKLGPAWIYSWRANHVTQLWSISPGPAVTSFGPFEAGDQKAEPVVIASLTKACAPSGCQLVVELPNERLLAALRAWQRILAAVGPRLGLQVRSPPSPPPRTPYREGLAGYLPPEVIQKVVRSGFEHIRPCYEAGLGRNPKLTGRVSVRFVIERDGRVKSAIDDGSDIPDTIVRDCVVHEFLAFKFPAVENGIVTVVYPIMLAPE
jgi:hypothetical protein